MKILFLNLPNSKKVVRRWMCSYNVSNFLLPPYELLSCATYLKNQNYEINFIDAIAEEWKLDKLINEINNIDPGIIFSITGFEILSNDIEILNKLKLIFPEIKFIIMGYYPSLFPELFLQKCKVDFIVRYEPEYILNKLVLTIKLNSEKYENIDNIAYRRDKKIFVNNLNIERIKNLDQLGFPDISLINLNKYSEPFMKKPFITIETARGCPYTCNYCIKTYGKKIYYRSVDSIINEIATLQKLYNLKSFRIMDDTFTLNKKRLVEFCKKLFDLKLNFSWTCLSRIDNIDYEKLVWMKKSGCKRIYIGVESGSQKILNSLNKGYDIKDNLSKFFLIKKLKIELATFFIVGSPEETTKDFLLSLKIAKKINPDFLLLCKFIPYPGTDIYNFSKDKKSFNLFPYKNFYKKEIISQIREKIFFRKFYFSPIQIIKNLKIIFKYPVQSFLIFYNFLKYLNKKENKLNDDFI